MALTFYNAIKPFHNEFWSIVLNITNKLNYSIDYPEWKPQKGRENSSEISLKIFKVKVPSKRKNNYINIFIHGGVGTDSNNNITDYRTRVSFTRHEIHDPKKHSIIEGIHYDYSKNTQLIHPIFHLQNDISVLSDEIISEGFSIISPVNIESFKGKQIKHQRIPTTQMDFYSVIIMILADNFINDDNLDDFKRLVGLMIESKSLSISINCTDLENKLHSNSCLNSLNYQKAPHAADWCQIKS